MHKIDSVLSVPQSKKKQFILNLNHYRNAHYRTLNTVKIRYKEVMAHKIMTLPTFERVELEFVFYPGKKYRYDTSNVCSIHEKFFCDALVELGKLPDDSYKYVTQSTYRFGDFDKENPRVEIIINEDS